MRQTAYNNLRTNIFAPRWQNSIIQIYYCPIFCCTGHPYNKIFHLQSFPNLGSLASSYSNFKPSATNTGAKRASYLLSNP